MNQAFQSLHEHEQRDVVLTLLQPSMLKFLAAMASEITNAKAAMGLPNVADSGACQQYVADIARQQERYNLVYEIQQLVQLNAHRFIREH